jgi:hypothetical protein
MSELPKYKCHKVVAAAKIENIHNPDRSIDDYVHPALFLQYGIVIEISRAYLAKHSPVIGGYYVRYEDGYESFSPAAAFESGYTKLEE